MSEERGKYRAEIVGVAEYIPEKILTNADLERFVDTTDEWIQTRTGIKTRHVADRSKGESTLTLAAAAGKKALEMAGMTAEELDIIIVGTVTPDTVMPTTANQVQAILGAKRAFSFDLQAACSGWVYGMSIADQFIRNGSAKSALIIGAETLSTIVNWRDRSTCVLFGDGAGAAVIRRTTDLNRGIVDSLLASDGDCGPLLCIPHGYGKVPPWAPEYRSEDHKVKMAGGDIFKHAVRNMVDASQTLLSRNNLSISDVNFFIFHQANIRIIDMCLKTLDIPKEKTWINVDKYGNTSAATLPVCLYEAWQAGAVKKGDLILFATFGGGLTWGTLLVRL